MDAYSMRNTSDTSLWGRLKKAISPDPNQDTLPPVIPFGSKPSVPNRIPGVSVPQSSLPMVRPALAPPGPGTSLTVPGTSLGPAGKMLRDSIRDVGNSWGELGKAEGAAPAANPDGTMMNPQYRYPGVGAFAETGSEYGKPIPPQRQLSVPVPEPVGPPGIDSLSLADILSGKDRAEPYKTWEPPKTPAVATAQPTPAQSEFGGPQRPMEQATIDENVRRAREGEPRMTFDQAREWQGRTFAQPPADQGAIARWNNGTAAALQAMKDRGERTDRLPGGDPNSAPQNVDALPMAFQPKRQGYGGITSDAARQTAPTRQDLVGPLMAGLGDVPVSGTDKFRRSTVPLSDRAVYDGSEGNIGGYTDRMLAAKSYVERGDMPGARAAYPGAYDGRPKYAGGAEPPKPAYVSPGYTPSPTADRVNMPTSSSGVYPLAGNLPDPIPGGNQIVAVDPNRPLEGRPAIPAGFQGSRPRSTTEMLRGALAGQTAYAGTPGASPVPVPGQPMPSPYVSNPTLFAAHMARGGAADTRFDRNSPSQLMVSANAAGMPISAPMARFLSLTNKGNAPKDAASWALAGLPPQLAPEVVDKQLMNNVLGTMLQNPPPGGLKASDLKTALTAMRDAKGGGVGTSDSSTRDVAPPAVDPKTGKVDLDSAITAANAKFPDMSTSRQAAQKWIAETAGIDTGTLRTELAKRRVTWKGLNNAFAFPETKVKQRESFNAIANILGEPPADW